MITAAAGGHPAAPPSILGVDDQGPAGGVLSWCVAITIGSMLTWLGLGIVQAATARALVEIDEGRPLWPLRAFRLALNPRPAAAPGDR